MTRICDRTIRAIRVIRGQNLRGAQRNRRLVIRRARRKDSLNRAVPSFLPSRPWCSLWLSSLSLARRRRWQPSPFAPFPPVQLEHERTEATEIEKRVARNERLIEIDLRGHAAGRIEQAVETAEAIPQLLGRQQFQGIAVHSALTSRVKPVRPLVVLLPAGRCSSADRMETSSHAGKPHGGVMAGGCSTGCRRKQPSRFRAMRGVGIPACHAMRQPTPRLSRGEAVTF
jgi:hypothetical protein